MNSVTVCGRLGADPEMKYSPSGTAVVVFDVAEDLRGTNGEETTQWWRCAAFGRVGELVHQYFAKGKPIFVTGHLKARAYKRRDGEAGVSLDVQVDRFEFVPFGSRAPGAPEYEEPAPPAARPSVAERSQQQGERGSRPLPNSAEAEPSAADFDVPDITDPFADQ